MLGISLIIKLAASFVVIVVVVAGVAVVLVYTGTPEPCVDREEFSAGDPSNIAPGLDFQNKWRDFKLRSASGPTSVTFSEAQITARGLSFLLEEGIEIENLQVFLCPDGYAEATATFAGGGPNIDFLARGTLDLSGDLPRIDIDKVLVGNLPNFLRLGGLVDSIDDDAKTLDIGFSLTAIGFTDGEVTLGGAP